jgi:hypothetical protein
MRKRRATTLALLNDALRMARPCFSKRRFQNKLRRHRKTPEVSITIGTARAFKLSHQGRTEAALNKQIQSTS